MPPLRVWGSRSRGHLVYEYFGASDSNMLIGSTPKIEDRSVVALLWGALQSRLAERDHIARPPWGRGPPQRNS